MLEVTKISLFFPLDDSGKKKLCSWRLFAFVFFFFAIYKNSKEEKETLETRGTL